MSQESSLKYQCLKTEQSNLQTRRFEFQEKRDILNQELSIHKEELVHKRSRLKSLQDLERNFEGYEEGVRSILKASKEKGQGSGVFGVVAQMLETGPQYEAALGAVLGEKLQYVIIDSHEKGIEAINYLKAQGTGRGSFIPTSLPMTVRDSAVSHFYNDSEGVLGSLIEKIKIKDGYQKLAQFLLGDTVLVDSLSRALDIWHSSHPDKTLVTLDGEVVDPAGVVSGGTAGIQGKMLLEKKREIREILEVVGEMENDIGLKEDSVSQLEGSLSEVVMTLEQTSKEAREEEMRCMTLDKEVVHALSELERLERELQKYQSQLDQLDQDFEKTNPFFSDYEIKRTSLIEAAQEREQAVHLLETDLKNLVMATRQIYDRLTSLRIEAAAVSERKNIAGQELDRLEKTEIETQRRLQERTDVITTANQKIATLHQNIQTAGSEKDVLKNAAQDVSVNQEEARLVCENLTISLKEKDEALKEARRINDLCKTKASDLRVSLSKLETEFEYLNQQMFERYTVVLAEYAPTCDAATLQAIDVAEEDAKSTELKEKISRMGEVNLGSIEEYEELKKREVFLSQQIQDLETSLDTLKKAIQKINLTTRKRFEETFHLVNERFQTLFPRLFQGGRAEMRLTDENDLLNSGVELLVQPRGKKLSHVGLLSGGEKALSAMAFVFSIFLVKPSPFCILDEVDAPLDDANAERYHHLLTEMVSRTQFILITHNRTTMERCDQLYGVTMQEPGCSQLVSVKLSDGLKMAS
ncbi:MAG: chromosome segregation protein SMC [Deltaproteobacteria bacterium]|nr:MAG: chromosome segregation protein SMC [Deltaproteobacteria bacterium]